MSKQQRVKSLVPGGTPVSKPMEKDFDGKSLLCGAPSTRVQSGTLEISNLKSLSIGGIPEHYGRKLLEEEKTRDE